MRLLNILSTVVWAAIFLHLYIFTCAVFAADVSPSGHPSLPTAVVILPSHDQVKAFREQMIKIPLPNAVSEARCFSAHYPIAQWVEETCGVAPTSPSPQHRGASHANVVGNGTDFFAIAPTGHFVTRAIGSFDAVDVKTETGPRYGGSQWFPDTYSLQINSNTFTPTVCNGLTNCAWVQFLYSTSQCQTDKGCVYLEYWLLNHPKPCPSGFTFYAGTADTTPGCYMNTKSKDVALQSWTELRDFAMEGLTGSENDAVVATTAQGNVVSVSHPSLSSLAQGWTGVEFNLVGDCCATQANFSNGTSTLQLRVDLESDSVTPISCSQTFSETTAESNNLNFTGTCTTSANSISFIESGGDPVPTPPPATSCAQLQKDINNLTAQILHLTENPPPCPSGIVAICSETLRDDEAARASMKADYGKRCR